ncbi:outer membrane beta-barrel protein [Sandarakinorhabdus glacialis]|uniref:outer membrane beta-barrel protein n=1 Tax=Sandarakinorhabdus glacialis TaxID=1614636 RepID=UPI00166639B5|nr:outer membrane beta-barrel protein [Polymorphobacter glacialis]
MAAASVTVGLSATAIAAPNTAGDDPSFTDTGLTSVPAVAGRGYQLEASVRTLYDSNILRTGDEVLQRPDSSKSDFRISPSVTASVGVPVGRQQIYLGGIIGRDFYLRNTRLNRNRYNIGGGVNLVAGNRCTGGVGIDFNSRQSLFSEEAEVVPNVQERLALGASVTCQGPIGIGFGGSVRRFQTRNKSAERNQFDVDSLAVSPQISYGLGNIGRFSLSGTWNQVSYPNRNVFLPGGGVTNDGAEIMNGRFGFQRELGSRFSISLGLSYLESMPDPSTIVQIFPAPPPQVGFVGTEVVREKFSGLGYDANITYQPSPRITSSLFAGRNSTASANVGAQFQVQSNFGVDVDYRLGSSMTVGAGATHNRRQYYNSFINVGDEGRRRIEDKINRVYASIGYAPVKLYSVNLLLAYQDRQSNPEDLSFNSFSALLSLRLNFGRQS